MPDRLLRYGRSKGECVLRRLLPVLLILVSAGCSSSNDRAPQGVTSDPLPHTDFGIALTEEDRQSLELAEQLRSVDPCGLIDRAGLASGGRPEVMTVQDSIFGCTVKVRTATAGLLGRVSVTMAGSSASSPSDQAETVRIEGMPIPVSHGPDSICGFSLPVSFSPKPAVQEPQSVTDPVGYVNIEAAAFDNATCDVAKETTASVIEAFRSDRIPRRDHAQIRIPLTDRSPCELVTRLPKHYSVLSFAPTAEPSYCAFDIEDTASQSGGGHIAVHFVLREANDVMRPPPGTQTIEQADGSPVPSRDFGNDNCRIVAPVGPSVESVALTQPPAETGEYRAVLALDGRCSVLDAIAPVARDLFGADR